MIEEPRIGLIVRPKRGSGRLWLVTGVAGGEVHLTPLGGDTGRWPGVKPLRRTLAEMSSWVTVRSPG